MRFLRRRFPVPAVIAEATVPEERPLVAAPVEDGTVLAASRFGLWVAEDGRAERWGWATVSKASLAERRLTVVRAVEVERWECDPWPDGVQVVRDLAARTFPLADRSGITDVVHARVRRSVAASRQVPGVGWVALRRIPGRDGVHPQVRLDPSPTTTAGSTVEVEIPDDAVDLALRALDALRAASAAG